MNEVFLIGKISSETELKYSDKDIPYLSFNLTITEMTINSKGKPSRKTDTFKVVAFHQVAEYVGNNLEKGDIIFVRGYLGIQRFSGANGRQMRNVYINPRIIHKVDMQTSKPKGILPQSISIPM